MSHQLESPDTPSEGLLPASSTQDTRVRRRWLVAGAVVAAVAALATVLSLAAGRDTALARAHAECREDGQSGLSLVDDDRTLVIDMKGAEDLLGVDHLTVSCVLAELETPARVVELMNGTRALDGRQSDTWDSFTATWSYHPDTGLDLLIVED